MSDSANKVKDGIASATDAVKNAGKKAVDTVAHAAQKASEAASCATEKITEKGKEVLKATGDAVTKAGEKIRDQGS